MTSCNTLNIYIKFINIIKISWRNLQNKDISFLSTVLHLIRKIDKIYSRSLVFDKMRLDVVMVKLRLMLESPYIIHGIFRISMFRMTLESLGMNGTVS